MKWRSTSWLVVFCVLLSLGFSGSSATSAENEKKPGQFKVTLKVIYNSITLVEAAALEARILQEHDDSCTISVELEKVSDDTGVILFGDTDITFDGNQWNPSK